ncbi:MAG TPA: hypothetical protein VMT75_02145 [Candidatus Saccharimonadales bacterium]|nr:hypothetical protein [Candidatus Saccharimonadales bacterium]
MKPSISMRGECLPLWQVLLSLVLVGLMLYNPFAGLWGYNDGLSYDHLARNRATVGASELQHFSPVSNSAASQRSELAADVPATGLLQVVREAQPHTDSLQAFPALAEFFTDLWNKPPPSL